MVALLSLRANNSVLNFSKVKKNWMPEQKKTYFTFIIINIITNINGVAVFSSSARQSDAQRGLR